jgi:hypothetical protein
MCCASVPAGHSEVERRVGELVSKGIDWKLLLTLARRESLLPLLQAALRRRPDVPPLVLEELAAFMREHTARSLALTSELLRLLDLLAANGIRALPLKGPVVAVAAYGSVSLREFRDLDIYVHPTDALRAKRVLMDDAYDYFGLLTADQESVGLHRHRYHYPFVRRDGAVLVELHWALCEWFLPFSDGLQVLFDSLVPIRLGGTTVMGLAPEKLLQYLCVHGTKHLWGRLKMVADVAALIERHRSWNWDEVLSQARRYRLERPLVGGLSLARELLGADVPPGALSRLWSPRGIGMIHAVVGKRLTTGSKPLPAVLERLDFYLRMSSSPADKVRGGVRFFLEHTIFSWTDRPLPAPLAAAAYGLLRHARTRPTRSLALMGAAFVSLGYYLLLPALKRLRAAGRALRIWTT